MRFLPLLCVQDSVQSHCPLSPLPGFPPYNSLAKLPLAEPKVPSLRVCSHSSLPPRLLFGILPPARNRKNFAAAARIRIWRSEQFSFVLISWQSFLPRGIPFSQVNDHALPRSWLFLQRTGTPISTLGYSLPLFTSLLFYQFLFLFGAFSSWPPGIRSS